MKETAKVLPTRLAFLNKTWPVVALVSTELHKKGEQTLPVPPRLLLINKRKIEPKKEELKKKRTQM